MKKRILILMITLLFVISPIFARPQFFFGGGVEWGKLYPGVNEKEVLSHNDRFNVRAVFIDIYALAQFFVPMQKADLMVIVIPKHIGIIKTSPDTFRVIEWAATTVGPNGLKITAAAEKQATSIVLEIPIGNDNLANCFSNL